MYLLYFVFIGILFTSFLKYSFWRYKYSQLMPGRKPSFYDFFADARQFLAFRDPVSKYSTNIKFMNFLGNMNKIYQNVHLFCLWFLYTPIVCLVKADAVKEVLRSNNLKEKSRLYEFLKPVFGSGLITGPYATWKPRRKLLNMCFSPDILRTFLPMFNKSAQNLVEFFRKSEHTFTEIHHPIVVCSLDIICEAIFDVKLENDVSQYAKSIQRCNELFMKRFIKVWQWPDIIFWNTQSGKKAKCDMDVINEFAKKVLCEKKERFLPMDPGHDKGRPRALLDVLLHLYLVDHEITEEEVTKEINSFVLAGHDTVAFIATWALYLIGQYPNVQEKIYQELNRLFGEDTEKDITEEDLNHLEYLDCVIKETLRLYPPVPMIGRHVEEEMSICGHTIPKGASCLVLPYFLHRDEDVFPDPEKFDPNRFLPENFIKIPQFAYIPFSTGPRNCIGYKFATMEIKILIATVLRNFSIETSKRNKVVPVMQVTLHPSSSVYVRFRPRAKQGI